jgi:predicted RNA-binding protein YlxR (DUF448 family)
MAKTKGRRTRPMPQRTCIVCRQTQAKRGLVRVVRTPTTGVRIDPTGKVAGRGAYLCRNRVCWERALSGGRLSGALKTTLTTDELAGMHEFAAGLPEIADEESELPASSSVAISPT